MIELVIFDIDGVLTNGNILIDAQGKEQKCINTKDLDGISELKQKGYKIAAVTKENTEIVGYFKKRFPWDVFCCGCNEKISAVNDICNKINVAFKDTAYIGDGKYDLEVMKLVGMSFCPSDAIEDVKHVADVVLSSSGGTGCAWEMLGILEKTSSSSQGYFLKHINEHQSVFSKMCYDKLLSDKIMFAAEAIADCIKGNGQIFLCGNGGSAADAQHIAAEFVGRFFMERPAMCAEALTVNTSILTAIGNDYGYEKIFVRQIEAKTGENNVLIGISTSGSSANVYEALIYAKKKGMLTILMTGEKNLPELNRVCDFIINVPSSMTPRIQEAHIFIGHLWAEYAETAIYGDKK